MTESAVLFLRLPGCTASPAGIVVSDPDERKILVQLRPLLEAEHSEEDMADLWGELPEMIQEMAEEVGPTQTLTWMEQTWSHVLEIGTRTRQSAHNPAQLLRSLFEANVLTSPVVQQPFGREDLERAMRRLPLMPAKALEVLIALRNPDLDPRSLSRALEGDPVLTAVIMRFANSAAFVFSHPVRTVLQAITRIGLEATILQVFAASVSRAFAQPVLRDLWDHAILAAESARQIASAARMAPQEAALLALVHDIGQIVIVGLDSSVPNQLKELRANGRSLLKAEMELCGSTHAEIGAELLRRLHFPDDFCEAVKFHHAPDANDSRLAALLYVVESGQDRNEDHGDPEVLHRALSTLGIKSDAVTQKNGVLSADLEHLRAHAS